MKVQNHTSGLLGKLAILLIVLELSLVFVNASTLKEVIISDTINPDKSITETISITIENNTDKAFSMTLPSKASNIYVNDNRVETINISEVLNCALCNMKIRYTIPDLIKQESMDRYSFYRTLSTPQTPKNFKYVVYLPKGNLIEDLSNPESGNIVPFPHEVLSDGESIILVWDETSPEFPKQYLVKYVSHEVKESFWQTFSDLMHLSVILSLIIILAFGFVGGLLYKEFYNKKTKKPISKIPNSLLSPDEKTVLEFLKKSGAHKNPINQKLIGRELNWSKSKTSGVLANLSYKKIIEKEKVGRNYSVKLIKEVE